MFFRPYDPMVLSVGIIGPGLVGSTLIDQVNYKNINNILLLGIFIYCFVAFKYATRASNSVEVYFQSEGNLRYQENVHFRKWN